MSQLPRQWIARRRDRRLRKQLGEEIARQATAILGKPADPSDPAVMKDYAVQVAKAAGVPVDSIVYDPTLRTLVARMRVKDGPT